ncbi:sigma-70 family RNA polymerase sigma factor [Phenylobacterium montanum]|uniref:Sigma-70 family RNA polymerase sigma factor n=1 Tax=Phenylobacterium montanum TaxID=2823693 RepID=A0A975FZH8_9CAUL|nr:sigma-70 family RNA polymerase sigma factor [Caulobacter sp. S6]QUD87728.1 sigma-70 family RNA polymerase sigma factor [Caulobacter sp. S6]
MSTAESRFQADLLAVVPHLRAFGRSLAGDKAEADDLVQETLLKAWAARGSFTVGTNMKAWTFMILRNLFYSTKRRSWRQQPLDPEMAERTLVAADDPTAAHELSDMRRAMMMLCPEQREALILIGAAGMSYDDASLILDCAVGTVKSRVSRARQQLVQILAQGDLPATDVPAHRALDAIMADALRLHAA